MSSADSDRSGDVEPWLGILSNSRIPGRLRALAGTDLLEVLRFGGLPLLFTHMGDDLLPMLEEARDQYRAAGLLWRIGERDGPDPELWL